MPERLSNRALNRATLARQLLLERSGAGIVDTIEFLGGLHAQQSNDPYIGLWSRLAGFRHETLTALIVDKVLLRATTMRGTLHLHSVPDLVGFRALVQEFLSAQWKSNFLRRFGDEDRAAVRRAGIRQLDKGPTTAGALGRALQEKFPTAEPLALSALLQLHETLIQIPPTRLWGNGSAPLLQRIETYLPNAPKPALTRTDLVRRYLASYGPASINDMQIWCRLTKLGAEFAAIRDELVTFEDEDGRMLYDLPDAPRPDENTPAPVRFLPLYDNVYLGYDDRRRMLSAATAHLGNMFQAFKPAVLIDGQVNAGWTLTRTKAEAVLDIAPYRALLKREQREIEREGLAFLKFMRPDATSHAVRVAPPA